MVTKDKLLEEFNVCADRLASAGLVPSIGELRYETLLIGSGSVLDSIAFITLVTEFEEAIVDLSGNVEFSFALMDLADFDELNPMMTVGKLIDYSLAETTNRCEK